MDCMAFGMGCCCLQGTSNLPEDSLHTELDLHCALVTFQACCIEEARRLYDQLAVISPILVGNAKAATSVVVLTVYSWLCLLRALSTKE